MDVVFVSFVSSVFKFVVHARRPHPNECSGSALDGDIYFVSWDQPLIPIRMVAPMDYTPAPSDTLDHKVKIEVL